MENGEHVWKKTVRVLPLPGKQGPCSNQLQSSAQPSWNWVQRPKQKCSDPNGSKFNDEKQQSRV